MWRSRQFRAERGDGAGQEARLGGGGFGLTKAQQQRPEHLLVEVLEGLVAGNLGSRLPDVSDPPTPRALELRARERACRGCGPRRCSRALECSSPPSRSGRSSYGASRVRHHAPAASLAGAPRDALCRRAGQAPRRLRLARRARCAHPHRPAPFRVRPSMIVTQEELDVESGDHGKRAA